MKPVDEYKPKPDDQNTKKEDANQKKEQQKNQEQKSSTTKLPALPQVVYIKNEDSAVTLVMLGAIGALLIGILLFAIVHLVKRMTTHPNQDQTHKRVIDNKGDHN